MLGIGRGHGEMAERQGRTFPLEFQVLDQLKDTSLFKSVNIKLNEGVMIRT